MLDGDSIASDRFADQCAAQRSDQCFGVHFCFFALRRAIMAHKDKPSFQQKLGLSKEDQE